MVALVVLTLCVSWAQSTVLALFDVAATSYKAARSPFSFLWQTNHIFGFGPASSPGTWSVCFTPGAVEQLSHPSALCPVEMQVHAHRSETAEAVACSGEQDRLCVTSCWRGRAALDIAHTPARY